MARRSPPRKVTYFEPVRPRLARNTIIGNPRHHLWCMPGGSGCSRKNRTISPVASGPRGRV